MPGTFVSILKAKPEKVVAGLHRAIPKRRARSITGGMELARVARTVRGTSIELLV